MGKVVFHKLNGPRRILEHAEVQRIERQGLDRFRVALVRRRAERVLRNNGLGRHTRVRTPHLLLQTTLPAAPAAITSEPEPARRAEARAIRKLFGELLDLPLGVARKP